MKPKDLTGRRFGRLLARYPTGRRDRKLSVYWNCICDCGNESEVTADRLMHGTYLSCGCLKKENQQNIFKKLHLVDGTCVEWLEKRKSRSDNTSGFRGVYHMKNGKYRVSIGFRGKRYHIGTYEGFEQAVEARQKAEETMHGGFLDAYYRWEQQAEQDPLWKEQHPFRYEMSCSPILTGDNKRQEDTKIDKIRQQSKGEMNQNAAGANNDNSAR